MVSFFFGLGMKHGNLPLETQGNFMCFPYWISCLRKAQLAFGELNDLKGVENIALFVTGVLLVSWKTKKKHWAGPKKMDLKMGWLMRLVLPRFSVGILVVCVYSSRFFKMFLNNYTRRV